MAVPASGELKLWDDLWNQELGGTKGENSLHSASVYAGFSTPDALSDFYGWSDVEAPTITTQTETSVGSSTFTANGCVTNTGNGTVYRGFYMGTNSSDPGTANPKYTLPGSTTNTGAFSCNFTGLTFLQNYYYWAFGCNEAGETISCRQTATTTAPPFTPQYRQYILCEFSSDVDGSAGVPSGNTTFLKFSYVNPYTSTLVPWMSVQSTQTSIKHCQAQQLGGYPTNIGTCVVKNAKNVYCGRIRTCSPGPHYFCFDTFGLNYNGNCNTNFGGRLCCFAQCTGHADGSPITTTYIQTSPLVWNVASEFDSQGCPYTCRKAVGDLQSRTCFCVCLCSGL